MSTVTDMFTEPTSETTSSNRLRATMAAVRLMFTWFGTRKSLTSEQKCQAADTFGAEGAFLSAGKKLLDTKHPAFQAVTTVRGQISSFWRGITLPFPEPGIRLIRQDDIGSLNLQLTTLKGELAEAVEQLDEQFSVLKSAARQRLGSLFNSGDYPHSLRGLFEVSWEFPSVEPPAYLQQLSPQLYRQECDRVSARFNEALKMAEEAFTGELATLIDHLTERLSGSDDGKPKIFRDSAVENLREFFARFRHLNVGSNDQLENLVQQSQRILSGVEPQALRDNTALRQHLATQLTSVQSVLDGLMIDRPRRNILRRAK
jgi:hypothetical protein